jgi:hypothetical protein
MSHPFNTLLTKSRPCEQCRAAAAAGGAGLSSYAPPFLYHSVSYIARMEHDLDYLEDIEPVTASLPNGFCFAKNPFLLAPQLRRALSRVARSSSSSNSNISAKNSSSSIVGSSTKSGTNSSSARPVTSRSVGGASSTSGASHRGRKRPATALLASPTKRNVGSSSSSVSGSTCSSATQLSAAAFGVPTAAARGHSSSITAWQGIAAVQGRFYVTPSGSSSEHAASVTTAAAAAATVAAAEQQGVLIADVLTVDRIAAALVPVRAERAVAALVQSSGNSVGTDSALSDAPQEDSSGGDSDSSSAVHGGARLVQAVYKQHGARLVLQQMRQPLPNRDSSVFVQPDSEEWAGLRAGMQRYYRFNLMQYSVSIILPECEHVGIVAGYCWPFRLALMVCAISIVSCQRGSLYSNGCLLQRTTLAVLHVNIVCPHATSI